MVKINQTIAGKKADDLPLMWKHSLTATKDTRQFKKGDYAICFITQMSDGRYAVTDANFNNTTKYYEVFTPTELQESFNETP